MDQPTLATLDLYAGVICEACDEGDAVVTDVNGIDLCAECAEGCRLPDFDA